MQVFSVANCTLAVVLFGFVFFKNTGVIQFIVPVCEVDPTYQNWWNAFVWSLTNIGVYRLLTVQVIWLYCVILPQFCGEREWVGGGRGQQ